MKGLNASPRNTVTPCNFTAVRTSLYWTILVSFMSWIALQSIWAPLRGAWRWQKGASLYKDSIRGQNWMSSCLPRAVYTTRYITRIQCNTRQVLCSWFRGKAQPPNATHCKIIFIFKVIVFSQISNVVLEVVPLHWRQSFLDIVLVNSWLNNH